MSLPAPLTTAPLPHTTSPRLTTRTHTHHLRPRYAEIGSSAAILDAGYNIDSLMLRYQVRGARGLEGEAQAGAPLCCKSASKQLHYAKPTRLRPMVIQIELFASPPVQGVDWRDKTNWGCNAGWVALGGTCSSVSSCLSLRGCMLPAAAAAASQLPKPRAHVFFHALSYCKALLPTSVNTPSLPLGCSPDDAASTPMRSTCTTASTFRRSK